MSYFYYLGMSSGRKMSPSLLSESINKFPLEEVFVSVFPELCAHISIPKKIVLQHVPFLLPSCVEICERFMETCVSKSGPCQPIFVGNGNSL